MDKKYILTPEEQEIEDAMDYSQQGLSAEEEKVMGDMLQAAAKNYLAKDARINIRLSTADLNQLKRRAAREGLPYQTMISSILHKVANGILDKHF